MTVDELVAECLRLGRLDATARGQRSLTVEGVSLPPIRWQAAVFTARYGGGGMPNFGLPPRAAHLADAIREALANN